MLAVVWGVEHFHVYLFGSAFKIKTDHKPLLRICNNHKPTSALIERWRLCLVSYNYKLVYRLGKDWQNPADYMSRLTQEVTCEDIVVEEYIIYVLIEQLRKRWISMKLKQRVKLVWINKHWRKREKINEERVSYSQCCYSSWKPYSHTRISTVSSDCSCTYWTP